jgi:formate dehydrogenase major subunit
MCLHGLGVTEHLQGTEGVMCLVNLALLTGNVGRPGAGVNPLRGQNNVQGAALMGCEPNSLPGAQPIGAARERFEAAWGAPIPEAAGLDLLEMMDAAAAGRLKALWVVGYDIYLTLAQASATAEALGRLEALVVQDLFLNETAARFGTVFLPAASFLERDGTFMNADRRVQRIRRVVEPPGEARPDWWIVQEVARRLGCTSGFDFESPADIWDEVRRLWPAVAGLPYDRMERESPPWPCPAEDHPGTPVLHVGDFAGGHRAALAVVPFLATPEQCDDDYPLLLSTGRTLYAFNAGTMTGRTPNRALRPTDLLEVSSADAAGLGLATGDAALVTSRHGQVTLPVHVTDRVRPGELFTTFHDPALFVNRLTSPVRDRQVHAPEYKVTAVRVEPAGAESLGPAVARPPDRA